MAMPRRRSLLCDADPGAYARLLNRQEAEGFVEEYPWPPTDVVVNGRTVWPVALVEAGRGPNYSGVALRR